MIEKLIDQLKRIKFLSDKQLEDPTESSQTIVMHLNEELGEACTAICVEDGSKVKGYKVLDESSKDESVDVIICAVSLYCSRGGKIEDLHNIMAKKLDKWESKIQI